MAQKKTVSDTSRSVEEIRQYAAKNIAQYQAARDSLKTLRDVTKESHSTINTFTKENLRSYLSSIGSNESNLRDVARYLYYRSHIFFRLVQFYSGMYDLRCRKVIPQYSLTKTNNDNSVLKSYSDSLDVLEIMNLHNNMTEVLQRNFVEDVSYSIFFMDDTGAFFYALDPDYCRIDGRYMTGDYGFSVNMTYYRSVTRQKELEFLGEPLTTMYKDYQSTGEKWQPMPDEYAACFKFRTDDWTTIVPPFVSLFNSLINLEDLVDVQAIADEQQIYKLIYLPMKVLSGTKQSDDFEISPDLMLEYFDKLVDEAIPDYVSAVPIPGDKLDYIDFSDNAVSDTDRVEQASTTVLNTSGGGAVLNSSQITSTAAFNAWLKAETEFAMSTLLPQINGFANRILQSKLGNRAARVEHFEVSIYTKEAFAEKLLESCQYSFANRLAYNTCLGISEKETLAMNYLETELLKLQEKMIFPLQSSYTQSSTTDDSTYDPTTGQGRPTVPDDELSDSGERSRNE